jgi:LDH2 family malate/lactate/ureidoglycolate dehydrogenase
MVRVGLSDQKWYAVISKTDFRHKGYAIALMMDMLSGVLTVSGFGADVAGPYQGERRSRAGQLMIALNIESMQPLSDFNARMEELVAQIKAVPLAQGYEEVFYCRSEAQREEKLRCLRNQGCDGRYSRQT